MRLLPLFGVLWAGTSVALGAFIGKAMRWADSGPTAAEIARSEALRAQRRQDIAEATRAFRRYSSRTIG